MKIIYLGTPEFAIEPLDAIMKHGFEVAAVVTAPDKPAGRGKKLTPPPVKEYALKKGLNVLQPEKLRDPGFINQLKNLDPDIMVVVAFRMLPETVWSIPRKGTFNLHASLLPQYRGAAPINHAIMNGEKYTGLTTFFIDDKIDTGEILLQEQVEIGENETAGELHDRMMVAGAALVIKTLEGLRDNTVRPVSQSELSKHLSEIKSAPKIFREDCRINWHSPARQIHNFIRGLSPYPAAFTILQTGTLEQGIKIFDVRPEQVQHEIEPGFMDTDGKSYLKIACNDGFINILELQMPGKNRMDIRSFLAGIRESGKGKMI